jgi:hypothetical protein
MKTRTVVLSLLLAAGCSGSVSPAIELKSLTIPIANDAGKTEPDAGDPVDAGMNVVLDTGPGALADAGTSTAVGTDSGALLGADANEPMDSGSDVVAPVDAADAASPIVCTVAGTKFNQPCAMYAYASQTTMYFCTDGNGGAACPSADRLVLFSASDSTSWCCGP